MKIIICGGREYRLTKEDYAILDEIKMSEVVSGGCRGADLDGEAYASSRDIPIKRFPANWSEHGRAAGPIRNVQMARYADAVIAFGGGRGTANMLKTAHRFGLKIYKGAQR